MEFFRGKTLTFKEFFRGEPRFNGIQFYIKKSTFSRISSGVDPFLGKYLGVNAILLNSSG